MTERKAKRTLKNISFDGKDAHLALVSKDQGGPANGADYKLVIKSAKYTDEHVAKAAQVKVSLEFDEFLQVFFGLGGFDSEVLSRALGFSTPEEEMDEYSETQTYEDYITSKVSAIEIIKSLSEAENIDKALSELDPDDYISLLQSQAVLEKAFKKVEKDSKVVAKAATKEEGEATAEVVSTKEVTTKDVKALPSDKITKNKETPMTKEVKVTEQEVLTEMVEKSALDSIQKALQEQTVALEKALASVAQFEKEKAEAIQKSRKDLLVATVKDADKAEALFKGFANVESQEVFEGAVKALDAIMQVQKGSDLFKEVGVSAEVVKQDEQDPVMKALNAQIAKSKAK